MTTNLSVIHSIDKIIDWLRRNDTYATFFMVGELLKARPELLDKILSNGHEIAFHTMRHTRLDSTSYNKELFEREIKEFQKLTSHKSKGFRAPSFSLCHNTSWAIDVLYENNYIYDSSIVPAKTRLYGVPGAEHSPYRISNLSIEHDDKDGRIIEFPLLTTRILGKSIPAAGGFYLRTLPMWMIERAILDVNNKGKPAAFYIHSWEIAPEFMPKISLPLIDNFITYYNLTYAFRRMDYLLKKFKFSSFDNFIRYNNPN